ncbi:hypothetical protein A3C91_01185 [Candidatus Azambacteria bacterium RIFCSPHIGHO2_02_FULL_52_12]|uniref:RNHCP domain-containing protein n=1 Tax=Candidatus Azambacteria bacterium RIFCSPLOWO2_01_FULL_46_25 TaxID=1797298 RepID=A0A1F5BV76_9BACT|nr:MAG: hypothetical protein A3C91_01185 [Candidatus Azambacteria bacterium RIFCSPHIGHO2_02_FULL_52_12]OGD34507.1 MAG: hypothetical protein A2988_03245 [Candidatus Azambacteria bacterium RIFCSPLOWO2_01_FULL_46_25]OGD38008.1 MAG: hypothetical protein A2850_02855 [Candidatus Azambacteria bacterium RIFCSPHIGHO2_01_FULL_51_74]
MGSRKFTRTKEDFICEHCASAVAGNGYTNHCPRCLWAKHVDVNPGDRKESCGGMMEPVRVERKQDAYGIVHRCVTCGKERRNMASVDDDFDELVRIAGKVAGTTVAFRHKI